MRNVATFLYGQVLIWRVRLIFPVDSVGDFVTTHAVRVSQRNRQAVTKKCWRAEPPTIAIVVEPAYSRTGRPLSDPSLVASGVPKSGFDEKAHP